MDEKEMQEVAHEIVLVCTDGWVAHHSPERLDGLITSRITAFGREIERETIAPMIDEQFYVKREWIENGVKRGEMLSVPEIIAKVRSLLPSETGKGE